MSIHPSDLPEVPEKEYVESVALAKAEGALLEVLDGRDLVEDVLGGEGVAVDEESHMEVIQRGLELEREVHDVLGAPFEAFADDVGIDTDVVKWAILIAERLQDYIIKTEDYYRDVYSRAHRRTRGMPEHSSFNAEDARKMGMPEPLIMMMQSMANAQEGCPCEVCKEKREASGVSDKPDDKPLTMSEQEIADMFADLPMTDEPESS